MNFNIPCETFVRMSHVVKNLSYDYLFCLYVEQVAGVRIAITTNKKIAAFEMLGRFAGPDFKTWVSFDPALLQQCVNEQQYSSELVFVHVPDLKFTSVKTTFGYMHVGNVSYLMNDEGFEVWSNWRSWLPDNEPVQPVGSMFMNTDQLANLGHSSPSGRLVFPEVIDNRKPVVVRDLLSENWFGLFMANRMDDDKNVVETEPAVLPDWIKS